MGNIARGRGREVNRARGEAECSVSLSRPHPSAIFPIVHKRKRCFNWLRVIYGVIRMESSQQNLVSVYQRQLALGQSE